MKGSLVICPEFFQPIIKHTGIPFPSLEEFELQFAPETADGRWFYQQDEEALERSKGNPKHEECWAVRRYQERAERRRHLAHYHDDDVTIFEGAIHVGVSENGPFATSIVLRDRFRSLPDSSTMLPFLKDASDATKCIPRLRRFILKLNSVFPYASYLDYHWAISCKFELCYLKAGTPRSPKQHINYANDGHPKIAQDEACVGQNRIYWRVDDWRPWDEVQAAWSDVGGTDAKIVFLDEDKWVTQTNGRRHRYDGEF